LAALPALQVLTSRVSAQTQAADPLPSWKGGRAKQSILDFVAAVTREGSPDFVPPPERIATFDNDGTLWVEQPMYTQLAFALDRVAAQAAQHPEWKDKQPFKAVLERDMKALAESGERGMLELVMATHADMTTAEFEKIVADWLATARQAPQDRPALHRDGVPADARVAHLLAGERLPDVHRLRRGHRVHATVDGTRLRCAPRAGRGIEHQDQVRNARWNARAIPPPTGQFYRR